MMNKPGQRDLPSPLWGLGFGLLWRPQSKAPPFGRGFLLMSFRYCLFVIICGGLGMASGHPNRRLIITGSVVNFNCRQW